MLKTTFIVKSNEEDNTIRNKNEMKICYDQEADVLYGTCGKPEHTDYVEHSDDVILRID